MSSLFSFLSIFYIWIVYNHSKLFRFSKYEKNILLSSLKSKNKEDIEEFINISFIEYLKESKNFKKALVSFIFSFEDDIFWIFKIKNNGPINITKIKWYFKKKKQMEHFFDFNIGNTKYFHVMNNSGMYMREIGATDFSCMVYYPLKGEKEIIFGSSRKNLDTITFKYLRDYIVLERWRRRYLNISR